MNSLTIETSERNTTKVNRMNLYNESKLMKMVAKQQAGAKDGILKFQDKVYDFHYNITQDYYEVTLDGEIELRIKERSLAKAKAYFKNWMIS